ncbi:DNA-directed RNA polymerase [Philodulcilactobacillus myokoensis]|uniref:RNA polymerase sigma factor SigS n=1 Tax=Philodulcilactobacillus myokoensis TaxID=2929573 RepID=A0A9W6B1F6_9LACO|nr:sigma-70 family RNA polymerase sigma factor [Philodulcilactobacillus myokoensis]GLB47177.1 DNA-directed RNA polymerase [Philodulcilactobacillus myokoensis]
MSKRKNNNGNNGGKSFESLSVKYQPIVKSLWQKYYVAGMDFDDWNQEANLVMLKLIYKFDWNGKFTFGTFYRMALKNRIFDLIRKSNAKKRRPKEEVAYLDASPDGYTDTLADKHFNNPEANLLVEEKLYKILNYHLSDLESSVFKLHLSRQETDQIARQLNIDEIQVKNALQRCRRKLFEFLK